MNVSSARSIGIKALGLFAFLALWQVVTQLQVQTILLFVNIPSPVAVGVRLFEVMQTHYVYIDMWHTVLRVSAGVCIAALIGIPLGLIAGAKKSFEDLLFPITELLRPIPNIAWAPLVVVLFPVVEHSIIFITFIGAFFPILLNTIAGVRSIEKKYFYTAWTLHFSRKDKLIHLVLPAALPMILTGVRIGLGVSWLGVIVAEMLSGKNGIGYYTWLGYQLVDYTQILVGIVLIGALSTLSSGVIGLIENRVLEWRKI